MIDFSKMTPELYEKIQNLRVIITNAKKQIALLKFDDGYDENDEKLIDEMTNKVNEMSEELKEYEI
jgi:peptidoglycan/xylan/chitin deacetylase (PgdA/CDA1 family)